jgi:hypothetical protein
MATKTGEMREMLLTAMEQVRTGAMKPEQAKAIALLAQQVNLSVQVEVNAQINQFKWESDERKKLGHMPLGDENEAKVVSEQ